MYRHVDAALIRAPAYPSGSGEQPWPDLAADTPADLQRTRLWVGQAWAHPDVADAIEAASPSLAGQIEAIIAGDEMTPRHQLRAALSLARYLLRLRHRATPFGLLAGIAVARIGGGLAVRWGENHRPVARADAAWLADVITGLEASPELLPNGICRVIPSGTSGPGPGDLAPVAAGG
jgi:hypothetical protein